MHRWFLSVAMAGLVAANATPILADSAAASSTNEIVKNGDPIAQIAHLIEVWGFVKYHHPDATAGSMAMDQAFFELYPQIAGAESDEAVEALLIAWIDRIGIGAPCDPCGGNMQPQADQIATVQPTNSWIAKQSEPLALRLKAIYENRSAADANFQIEPARGVGNSQFFNEGDYKATGRDDPALRMLAVARMWNTLRYWFPYRDIMDADVASVLEPAVADTLAAQTRTDHQRALARLVAKSDDGHGVILAFRKAISPSGDCTVPYTWRFAEGQLVVDGLQAHPDGILKRGDIVRAIGGESVEALDARYSPTISASNNPYRKLILATRLMQGECGAHAVTVERNGETLDVDVTWLSRDNAGIDLSRGPGRDGPAIQTLESGITYVRFSQLRRSDLPALLETANAGAGVVFDMRGYVRDFLVFELGKLLVSEPTEFARFTQPFPATPGLFTWTDPTSIIPAKDGRRITVPIVALINENAASSPEYHAMAWRAAGVKLIGSPTAGADGNVSTMPLPQDGAGMRFSGIGVFYPDQSPTQRIGIVPDITVTPTIAGIAAGRDEPLERAIAELQDMSETQTNSDAAD